MGLPIFVEQPQTRTKLWVFQSSFLVFMRFLRSPLSLRWILGLTFGAMVLLLVALLTITVNRIVTRQLHASAQQSLKTLTAEMTDELERGIFERFREIQLLATTQPLLRDPQAPVEAQRALLEEVQRTYPTYSWIGLTDRQGVVRAATGQLLEGKSVAERPWFQAGIVKPHVSDVHEAKLLAQLLPQRANDKLVRFVDVVAPIQDANGITIGVLGAHLDWAWVRELEQALLQMHHQPEDLTIYILNQQEVVLAGPATEIGKPFTLVLLHDDEHSGADVDIHIETASDGEAYVIGHSLTTADHADQRPIWQVVARLSLTSAYAQARQVQQLLLGLGGLLALLFTGLGWWLAGRITQQLLTITEAADRIRQGELDVALPLLNGSIEVNKLSVSLHHLIRDLTTATTAERNRIARELHDSVTQTLFSASMLADVLPKVWEMNPQRGMDKLHELRQSVRGALAEMRTLLIELRPDVIQDTDLERLVRQLAEAAIGRSGMQVHWQIDDECILSSAAKVACYRTIQEALNNIVRHSEASQVHITLECDNQASTLVVRDDGFGFDPRMVTGDHFGLRNMRERIMALGGQFHIQSAPGEGTEVRVVL